MSLKLEEVARPGPTENEVLVKTFAAPINPSDIAFIQGGYNIVKSLPAAPGFEGSGQIVAAGKHAEHLIGRKVSAFVQDDRGGSWSDHFIAKTCDIILLNDEMDMEQASCFTVNPFTAYGLFDIAQLRESRAIIQNGSGGQTASFIRAMAKEQGLEVIDIVRKEELVNGLKEAGSKYVLLETADHFEEELKSLAHELEASTAFDAVGGIQSGILFNAMPADSELVGLSAKPAAGLDTMGLIFHNKIVSGFNLMDWKSELEAGEFENISDELQQQIIKGTYKTQIQDSFAMDNVARGIKAYISNMSGGKILIKP